MSTTASGAKTTFHLFAARRRDVERLRTMGPPFGVDLPTEHGVEGDPRYPSKRAMRLFIGFVIDFIVHLGAAVGVGMALSRVPEHASNAFAAGLATFLVLSIVHRILIQWACQTTLGKAVVGLVLVRDDTGGRPTLWSLVKAWLLGVFMGFSALG